MLSKIQLVFSSWKSIYFFMHGFLLIMPVIQHCCEVMNFLFFLVAVSDVLIDATTILGGEQTLKILSMKLFQVRLLCF